MMNQIPIKLLSEHAKVPTLASDKAAAYDIYAAEDAIVPAHGMATVSTGMTMAIPEGYFGAIYPRSGLANRYSIRLTNGVGVIDADYRGEWKVMLFNDSDVEYPVLTGDRIAQVIFQRYEHVDFILTDSLDTTKRGSNGFGSTGKN